MKKFRELVRETRVEDEGLPSEAALSLKDRRNKEAMPKLREQNDTTEKEEMAETQLHFIKYAAEEILEFIDMDGEIEEWYQNKLSKVHSDMEGLHSYVEGEKRRTGMVKEASAEELLAVAKKVSPNAKISTPETRQKDKEDYKKRTAKYAGQPNTTSAYAKPESYPLGGYDRKSNRSYSEEYESVPASKALQKAHEDERKKRGLPDPDYYLKLRDQKKKEIEDMKKEEVELDEISPGLAARAASGASDPDYEGRASHANISRMATKKFGAKIGGQISNTDKGHWPKEYGSTKQSAPSGFDKLSWRKPTRTTASGKANKQDISALKNRMKNEEVESLEEKNVPTSPEKWAQAKAQAKAKFDVYPSAYANGWAAKKYKAMGGGWKSVSEESELEEGYYKSQEIERQETERLAKQPPFTPDKPKKQVVAGKKPEGYSTARHLARQAMQKYKKPVKESLEESRRAEIVKEIIKKKKNEDKFNAEPIISDTVTRNT